MNDPKAPPTFGIPFLKQDLIWAVGSNQMAPSSSLTPVNSKHILKETTAKHWN